MSAQLMAADRPKFASSDRLRGTDVEVRAATDGYIAYYGTYSVDVTAGVVTHHVEGALFPNVIGGDEVRHFRLDGDRLTIRTPPMPLGGEQLTTVLVWQRAR